MIVHNRRRISRQKYTIIFNNFVADITALTAAQIIPSAQKKEVMPIIRRVVASGSDIYSDGWRSYDALAVYGYNHKKVKHDEDEFARPDGTHINGVESYWSWIKRRLNKFNGIPRHQFAAHMLESEWRFNHRDTFADDLKKLLSLQS